MSNVLSDFRYALRMLGRHRGFTAVVLLTLTLGITANTAIFSVVDAVLLRPLPYADAGRLVMVWNRDERGSRGPLAVGELLDWRRESRSFSYMAALDFGSFNLTGTGDPERLRGARVSADLFPLLGVRPLVGRWPRADEDRPGAPRVVLLSHALWQRRFGADPNLVGRTVRLDDESWTVIAVMPAGFDFPAQVVGERLDLWVPIAFSAETAADRAVHRLGAVGRLAPAVGLAGARSELGAVAARTARKAGVAAAEAPEGSVELVPLRDQLAGSVRRPLLLLLGAVATLLLIACGNIAGLLLARAVDRQGEMSLRAALGAGPERLLRQLATESLTLALLGSALALLLAPSAIRAVVALAPADLPGLATVRLDSAVLLFTVALGIVTGVIFGLAPAWQVLRRASFVALQHGARSVAGGRAWTRGVLLAGEVALTSALLVVAVLLVDSFRQLTQIAPGFQASGAMTAYVALPPARYPDAAARAGVAEELLASARALPGVSAAGLGRYLPMAGGNAFFDVTLEGTAGEPPRETAAYWRVTSPGYFAALGIPLRRGRDFHAGDRDGAPGVAIVSETMARRLWPGASPLGRRLKVAGLNEEAPWLEVVGVAGDVRHLGLDRETTPEVYVAWAQSPSSFFTLVLRTDGDPLPLAAPLRAAVAAIDPSLPLADVRPMAQVVARSVAPSRFRTLLVGIFAALALALAATGTYGLLAHGVAARTREIGVRVALGAHPLGIARLVMGSVARLTAIGLAVGAAGGFAVGGSLAGLLFGVDRFDPLPYGATTLLVAVVALVASAVPLRRAFRIGPAIALRAE